MEKEIWLVEKEVWVVQVPKCLQRRIMRTASLPRLRPQTNIVACVSFYYSVVGLVTRLGARGSVLLEKSQR